MNAPTLQPWPLRLRPGDDLRPTLEQALRGRGVAAAFVVAGIGSLKPARLRLAGADRWLELDADVELMSLSGSVGAGGSHLHACVADAQGRVFGGHLGAGCIVRTTAEVLLALLPGWAFGRTPDPATGYAELDVTPPLAR